VMTRETPARETPTMAVAVLMSEGYAGLLPPHPVRLIVVASAVAVRAARVDPDPGVVGGHALFEPLSRTRVAKSVAKAGRVVS
jgi:hypothetical protein